MLAPAAFALAQPSAAWLGSKAKACWACWLTVATPASSSAAAPPTASARTRVPIFNVVLLLLCSGPLPRGRKKAQPLRRGGGAPAGAAAVASCDLLRERAGP